MSRKRAAEHDDDDKAPAKKKPKLESWYTRTDPKTGDLGRLRRKDDKYWNDFTRRAKRRKERREAKAAKATKQDSKKDKKGRKKEVETKQDVSSESESGSDDDIDVKNLKRDDTETFQPFHTLTRRFKDHVCVITGGGRGIGQACAIRLAEEGGIIYILDNRRWKDTVDMVREAQEKSHNKRYKDKMEKYHANCHKNNKNKNKIKKPRKLKFKDRVFHKQCDVTDRKQVEETIGDIVKERGYIDVVLNCVNTTGKDYAATHSHKIDINKFDRIMKLNLYSTVNVCTAVMPYMKQEQYGRIVNLANVDGKNGHSKCLAFSAAKAAVINVTKTLGQEYAGSGITVNCIAPQYDEYHVTKLGKNVSEKALKVPMGRACDMEELAGTVAFIASEENTYTTGFCYDLSGGTSTY
eukprot:232738_1